MSGRDKHEKARPRAWRGRAVSVGLLAGYFLGAGTRRVANTPA
jgi:hypothetical protein